MSLAHPVRNRMIQAETVCKLLIILKSGRKNISRISEEAGLSTKTVGRYIAVLSTFFTIKEDRRGHALYFWIEEEQPKKGEGGRYLISRFCPRGHDKYAPHGGYWMKQDNRVWLVCAVCRRASNNARYARTHNL